MQYKDEIIAAIPTLLDKKQILYFVDLILIALLLLGRWIQIKQKENFKFVPVILTLRMYCVFLHIVSFDSRITRIGDGIYL